MSEQSAFHNSLRQDAEGVLASIAESIARAGVKSSVDYGMRLLGADEFNLMTWVDLDDPETVASALKFILQQGDNLVFSRLECPKAVEFATNLHAGEKIMGRVVNAYDPVEQKRVRRLDFVFKAVKAA